MRQVLAATDAPQAEDRTIAHAAAHLREAQVRQPVFGADPDRMRLARIQARTKIDIASPSVVRWRRAACGARRARPRGSRDRSEEHTSELQSLMRISYAVFCLKKKKKKKAQNDQRQ